MIIENLRAGLQVEIDTRELMKKAVNNGQSTLPQWTNAEMMPSLRADLVSHSLRCSSLTTIALLRQIPTQQQQEPARNAPTQNEKRTAK